VTALTACLKYAGPFGGLLVCLQVGIAVFVGLAVLQDCWGEYKNAVRSAQRLLEEELDLCEGRLAACVGAIRKARGPGQVPGIAAPAQPHGHDLPSVAGRGQS